MERANLIALEKNLKMQEFYEVNQVTLGGDLNNAFFQADGGKA